MSMDELEIRNEVLELTLACKRDDATPEQRARLERLLADDPRAIGYYLSVVDDTLTLQDAAAVGEGQASSADCADCQSLVEALEEAERDRPQSSLTRLAKIRSPYSWAAMACGVTFAVAGGWWMGYWQLGGVAANGVADANSNSARVVSVANVRWAEGAKEFKEWSYVRPGDVLTFKTGLVNLFLSNGAEVLIEGPADVTFESLHKVFAREGKLAARVGPEAIGFRIETPHANVIDRGTAFGVSVDSTRRTDVVVYEGMVDLDVLGDNAPPRRRLERGEALSVNRLGKLSRITTVQSSEFLEPPQVRTNDPDAERVITVVSDNAASLSTSKYYRVIPKGFREDCRAFVDRLHEWNGIDDRGLPPFLTGGDYVMTFNDDKITTGIEIAVTVNKPATLYLLVDDRVPPPDWLKRDFIDTQWDVGSDDGWLEGKIVTSLGTGESVDHLCSVWRRDVPDPSTVILGSLSIEKSKYPAQRVGWSMYGIVAQPLRSERGE
jgi:hypothetical protein